MRTNGKQDGKPAPYDENRKWSNAVVSCGHKYKKIRHPDWDDCDHKVATFGSGMLLFRLRCPPLSLARTPASMGDRGTLPPLLHPPPAAQGGLGQILTGFASSNLYQLIKNQPSRLG